MILSIEIFNGFEVEETVRGLLVVVIVGSLLGLEPFGSGLSDDVG